jgi:hypothetical protein
VVLQKVDLRSPAKTAVKHEVAGENILVKIRPTTGLMPKGQRRAASKLAG